MLVSILFTAWVVVASVLSEEVDKSAKILKIDPKTSNGTNNNKEVSSTEIDKSAEKDRSPEKDGSAEKDRSSEKDRSAEKDRSVEKDSSVEKDRSDEKDNSVERDRSTEKLSSKEYEEEGHSGVQNIDDKFTKTTTTTITPGSTLPPCAMCNFQSGGMFIPWSQPCPGCIYRLPICSTIGACCIMQPNCPVSQFGMPCPPNIQLGIPMALRTSLLGLVAPRLPLELPMAPRTSLVRPVSPGLPGTIPQIPPGINIINITKNGRFYGPVGGLIQSSGFDISRDLSHKMDLAANWVGVPGDLGAAGGHPSAGGLVQNNGLIHSVYQDPGLQSKIIPGPVGGLIQSSGYGTFTNWVGVPRDLGTAGGISTDGRDIQNNRPVHPVYQVPWLQSGGNMWGGYTMINPACPATKEACAELGGTCIPLAEKCGGVYKQDEQLCGSNCKCCIRSMIKECRDLDKNCLLWAREGYCNSYTHIKSQCKVSCGICMPKLGEFSPPASSTYISNQCQDKIPNCRAVASKSACATHSNMRELCPKTCGVTCSKSQALTQPKGGTCSHLTRNTCNAVMNGQCIPLNEECGGWFKQDPSLCGTDNCKCCIKEECNDKIEDAKICHKLGGNCIPATTKCKGSSYPLCGSNTCQCCVDNPSECNDKTEDAKICHKLGGNCIPATTKCKGSSYPLCGSNACQCCVDNPSAFGSCSQKHGCGIGGTCSLGGCREGYQVTDGQCPGPDCYCCKLKAHTICSNKPCGNGGTCRETTCLPGEVRLKENCGMGSCVCCKKDLCDTKKSCGSGGHCRCSICGKNEERIYGHCKGLDCICCKSKKSDFWFPEMLENSPPFLTSNVKESIIFPLNFKDAVPKCRPPKNNVCQKRGGDCIPLDAPCNGESKTKYCGKKKTCQCCLPYASSPFFEDYKYVDYSVRPMDHLIEVDDNEPLNPSVSLTDDNIESIQSIPEDNIQSRGEDNSQSMAVDNIESMTEDNSQFMGVDNDQSMVVDDAQSMVADNIESIAAEDISSIEKEKFQSMATNDFSVITADAYLASNNKVEDNVVYTPSINNNTSMSQERLVDTPSNYYVDYQVISNDPVDSNYELNNLPEINMLDYYDSVNIPLGGIEPALNSKEYYDINDISSMVKSNEKDIKDNSDVLNENPASDLDPLQNSNDKLDYLNYMSTMDLDPSLDIKEYYDDMNNVDSVPAKSTTNLKDYYEEGSDIPTMDYYNQVDGNPSMDSGAYLSNYDNIYPSVDDDMKNIPSSDNYYSLGENDYYNNMADYPIMNNYGDQY